MRAGLDLQLDTSSDVIAMSEKIRSEAIRLFAELSLGSRRMDYDVLQFIARHWCEIHTLYVSRSTELNRANFGDNFRQARLA